MTFERLPKSICPINYDIFIETNLENFIFTGRLSVTVNITEPTRLIRLNSADLTFKNVQCNRKEVKSYELDEENEEIRLLLESVLQPGEHEFQFEYTGIHSDKLKGFYRTKSTRADGSTYFSLASQFCATDARRVFPCWDEPNFKATFTCALDVPNDHIALSNCSVVNVENNGSRSIYRFEKTPIMSSYLLAFCVGSYDFIEAKTNNGVVMRVYTEAGNSEQGRFALETGIKSLEYYEDYFNIKYPLSKCDMIAIPDFKFGAMENWGLITYRSVSILFDQEKSSTAVKQRVAYVVCHELAHQWFGNLVTMEWWTHLWLNEGFATFMGYLCTDFIYPEWEVWNNFISGGILAAMELDSLESSHPIEVPVGHPSETDEIFDMISYNKGCAIIRMVHSWISDDHFRSGMQVYLNKHAYNNALTEDLWDELEAASKLPVREVMKTWTSEIGFPLISVKEIDRTETGVILSLTQKKYSAKNIDSKTIWSIPLIIKLSNGSNKRFLMTEETMQCEIECSSDIFIKLNPDFINWHLVRYDASLMSTITRNLTTLSTLDRLTMSFETMTMAKSGIISLTNYLDLIQGLREDDEYCIWKDICSNLSVISRMAEDIDVDLNNFKIDLLIAPRAKLGEKIPGEPTNHTLLRGLLNSHLISAGHKPFVEAFSSEMKKKLTDEKYILSADDAGLCYRNHVMQTNSINDLVKLHQRTTLTEEKNRIESSLGFLKTESKLEEAAAFIMSDSVRNQDKDSALVWMAHAGKLQRDFVLKYTFEHIEEFRKIFDGVAIGRYLKNLLSMFSTREMHDKINSFFGQNPIRNASRSIDQGLEDISIRASILERDGANIKQYFK